MRKKIRPLKYPRENIFDHQIPTRKAFGLTKYSGEKVSFTKSTCLQLLHGLTVLKKFHRISESSDSRQTEAVTAGVLWKEMFLKISQNSQENTFAKVSFLISCRLESCDFIQKQALSQVLIFEFREIFKKNLLQDTFVRLLLKLSSFFCNTSCLQPTNLWKQFFVSMKCDSKRHFWSCLLQGIFPQQLFLRALLDDYFFTIVPVYSKRGDFSSRESRFTTNAPMYHVNGYYIFGSNSNIFWQQFWIQFLLLTLFYRE